MKNILPTLILGAIGVGITAYGVVQYSKGNASTDWPSVDGRITYSSVNSRNTTSGTGSSKKRKTIYEAKVTYEYRIGPGVYTSKKISYGGQLRSKRNRSSAQQIVNKYPLSKQVKVYYSPDNHEDAVLEVGIAPGAYLFLGGGGVFLILMVISVVMGLLGKEIPVNFNVNT